MTTNKHQETVTLETRLGLYKVFINSHILITAL